MFLKAARSMSILLLMFCVALSFPELNGQYFGRNTVRYRSFDFELLKTAHFDIHYYPEEREAAVMVSQMAERWYARLSLILEYEFTQRQPLILYASHPHFRQTNTVPSEIGEATGGVTEFLKRRVVMPMALTMGETDHVLGHELVHAFQFAITGERQTMVGLQAPGAAMLPLWFVEGMAEYLSLGPIDARTAMWLRDAVEQDQLPDVRDLDDPRFFPYRWGHAFWAFVGGRYGDKTIGQILKRAGSTGDLGSATGAVLGVSVDELFQDWHDSVRSQYAEILESTLPLEAQGEVAIEAEEFGQLNLGPALSPDGSKVAYLSERGLFSVEMYVLDLQTGERTKITETVLDPHLEALQFVNSAGVWSPDGRRFVFAAIAKGRPILSIIDMAENQKVDEIVFPELDEVFNPAWSPDGGQIAFSATSGGFTDLFIVDVQSRKTRRVTQDAFADLHPSWSPDGRHISFTTDRFTSNMEERSFGSYRLAIFNVQSGEIRPLASLNTGNQLDPEWSSEGDRIYFISDHTGIWNVFRLNLRNGRPIQVTNLRTGVGGLGNLSPAISMAAKTERLVLTVFHEGAYSLVLLDEQALGRAPRVAAFHRNPAALPPEDRTGQMVAAVLEQPKAGLVQPQAFETADYNPSLSLDFIAQPSVFVGVSNFGSFVGGGTALQFSDMLGNHNLTTIFQVLNDDGNFLNNLSALAAYENRKTRWNQTIIGGQVPFVTGGFRQAVAGSGDQQVLIEDEVRFWQINRELAGRWAYPLSRAQRFEFQSGYRNIDFEAETRTSIFSTSTGQLVAQEKESIPTPDPLHMGTASTAFVYDTSIFGGTSPILGQRYRFELAGVLGNLDYYSALADYRRYLRPFQYLTLAGRLLHFGRYGKDAEDSRLQDLFIGFPSIMRGYTFDSFSQGECEPVEGQEGSCPVLDQLFGSRMLVANAEARIPLLGLLGVIRTPGLPPVELAVFHDAGVAWTGREEANFLGGPRSAVRSYGASLRVNLLGFAIAQISYVNPVDRPQENFLWEFSLVPGF